MSTRKVNGVDSFMVERKVNELLKELEKDGWTQGEVEMFPECMRQEIKRNSERIEKIKPFTVCNITQESL